MSEVGEAGSTPDGGRKKGRTSHLAEIFDEHESDDMEDEDETKMPEAAVKPTRKKTDFTWLVKNFDADVDKTLAHRYAKKLHGCSWLPDGSNSAHADWRCGTHKDCATKIRLAYARDITGAYAGARLLERHRAPRGVSRGAARREGRRWRVGGRN